MTQSECAVEHLLQAIKREVCKPDSYLPQSITSAYLDVVNCRRDECCVCGESSPPEPG